MRTALAAAIIGVLLMAAANACNDDGPAPDGDVPGARSPCSTGPAYVDAGQFNVGPPDTAAYPECLARCGTSPSDGIAQVPSGACTVPGETCDLSVSYPCPGTTGPGRMDTLRCACASGAQWQCVIADQGTTCAPASDAGSD